MLRGAKKNMIVVRTRDSRVFEEAYFVMRRDRQVERADDPDILWEANRILEAAIPCAERAGSRTQTAEKKGMLKKFLWFGAGLISGGAVGVILGFLC